MNTAFTSAVSIPGPVAIGGLGGSGTRVFSALMQQAGFYMGSNLNGPLDNLWFTILFKRRQFVERGATPAELDQATRIFVTAMTSGLTGGLPLADRKLLDQIRATVPPQGNWRVGAGGAAVEALINSTASPKTLVHGWGWKEPNTHVFLEALDQRIAGFRYIHIVRDALDMAFSANTWQVKHWGSKNRKAKPDDTDNPPLPVRQLRFWTAANHKAIEYGTTHMKDRFMVIGYERFCANPKPHWQQIMRFLDRPTDTGFPADLISPTSIGRRDDHDLSMFPKADLAAAAKITGQVAGHMALP